MPREALDRQMHQLQDEVLLLGSMVEQAVLNAVDCLKRRDTVTATRIYDEDQLVNEKRFAIENAVLILIATQQPIARDLRMLAAMLEVIGELERIGDYAKGIAKVTVRLGESSIVIPIRDIEKMAESSVNMLHRGLTAFIEGNIKQASAIPLEDDEIDDMYNHIYRHVINMMIANPQVVDQANLLLWVAHNLERVGDRVTNICERTVFIITGELLEFDSTDDNDTEN
jgi:phosphate transport system protein